jgi:hypothetical protein
MKLKSSYIANAITLIATRPAKASGMRCWLPAVWIRLPMPLSPAVISASTVPTKASVIAIFSDANR